jgi:hypothetical protein
MTWEVSPAGDGRRIGTRSNSPRQDRRRVGLDPGDGGGLLTSGTSVFNLIGLAVARHALAGFGVRSKDIQYAPQPLSRSSIQKAVELATPGADERREIGGVPWNS